MTNAILPSRFGTAFHPRSPNLTPRDRIAARPRRSERLLVEGLEPRQLLATDQNFDLPGTGTPYVVSQFGVAPPPTVMPGGPTGAGNLMRLVDTTVVNVNSMTFNRSDPDAFDRIVAEFDFRMTPEFGRADGFGFALLDTAVFGLSGGVGGTSEEPNFPESPRTIGFGFDIHQGPGDLNNNHISVHRGGVKLRDFDAGPVDLAGGGWIHATIELRPGDGFSDVTVVLTPSGEAPVTVIDHHVVPGFTPYESRAHFMGRSGGQSAQHDLDNVNVQYLDNPPVPILTMAAASRTVAEDGTSVVLTVNRSGDTTGTVGVSYTTADLTALAGSDYTAKVGELEFGPNVTTMTVNVPIIDDTIPEPSETFAFVLSSPSGGAVLGTPSETTVTITDNDTPPPEIAGLWGDVLPFPTVPIHMVMLPNGKIVFWDRHNDAQGWDGDPRLWDPATGIFSDLPPLSYDIFCSGHGVLPDGTLLVTGGHQADEVGEVHASAYNFVTNTWSRLPDMNAGRWYPSNATLPDGTALVIGGTIRPGVVNPVPQVWDPDTGRWRDLTGAPQGSFPEWADFYPWTFVAPDGRVFVAGPQRTARLLDTSGTGAWSEVADSSLSYRDYGSVVMYADGRVMIVGGNPRDPNNPNNLPSASAEVIDLNAASPAWQQVAAMSVGRRHHNTTVLPNGEVLVTGGSSANGFDNPAGEVLHAEVWDPEANVWTTLASARNYRGYHSNALLLPDARVVVAGGGHGAPEGGPEQDNAEIFSPPYLFQETRPTITFAPESVAYGQDFRVQTPDAATISRVSLISIPSVTHAFNQNQRYVQLDFTQVGGSIEVAAPANGNLAPPGYYMLFVLTGDVPSIAKIVRVSDEITSPPSDSGDFDGNGVTDLAVFRPSTAQWLVHLKAADGATIGTRITTFGAANLFDVPTLAPIGSLRALGRIEGDRSATFGASGKPPVGAGLAQSGTSAAEEAGERIGMGLPKGPRQVIFISALDGTPGLRPKNTRQASTAPRHRVARPGSISLRLAAPPPARSLRVAQASPPDPTKRRTFGL